MPRSIHSIRAFVAMLVLAAAFVLTTRRASPSDTPTPSAPRYTVTEIAPLTGPYDASVPFAINNAGDVVGMAFRHIHGIRAGFLWKDGKTVPVAPVDPQHPQHIPEQSIELGGINDLGQIAGQADSGFISETRFHAWTTDEKNLSAATPLPESAAPDTPPFLDSQVLGINRSGTCIGTVWTADAGYKACEWRRGKMYLLGTLGGENGFPAAVNDQERIVGFSEETSPGGGLQEHAFVWTYNGGMRDLGTLGGIVSHALDINNMGQIVGFSTEIAPGAYNPPPIHACFWDRGTIHDLGLSPTNGTAMATGINDNQDMVGIMQMAPTPSLPCAVWHSCLWHRGHRYDLNDIVAQDGTWEFRSANEDQKQLLGYSPCINEQGQIIGYGIHDGKIAGYVLTPEAGGGTRLSTLPSTRAFFARHVPRHG